MTLIPALIVRYIALVDGDTAALASLIGSRVKQERQARGWTLDQLAEATGVSRRMVVSVEQGEVNPSVGTLLRLSEALGVGLPALVEPPERAGVTVTRRGDGAALWTGDNGGRGVMVAGFANPDAVELWDWSLGPGDIHESEAHTSGTRELVHVLNGSITVGVGGEEVTLKSGDAAAFPGDVAHSYANPGRRAARFFLSVFEPGAATRSRTTGGR